MNNDTNVSFIYNFKQPLNKHHSSITDLHLKLIFLLENSQFQNTVLRNILKPLKTFDLFNKIIP